MFHSPQVKQYLIFSIINFLNKLNHELLIDGIKPHGIFADGVAQYPHKKKKTYALKKLGNISKIPKLV